MSLFSNVSHRYLVYIFSRTQISLARYRLIFCRSFLLSTSLLWQTFQTHTGVYGLSRPHITLAGQEISVVRVYRSLFGIGMSLLTNLSHRHLVYNFSCPQTSLADLVTFLFWLFSFGIYVSLLTYLSHVCRCLWSVMSSDYADWQDIICSVHFVSIVLYWYLCVSFGIYGSLLTYLSHVCRCLRYIMSSDYAD